LLWADGLISLTHQFYSHSEKESHMISLTSRSKLILCALLLTGSTGFSEMAATPANAAPSAAAAAPSTEPISATVVEIKGHVQARMAHDQPWKTATEQMVLPEGAEIRTGPRSSVTFVIPPDQTITLDRLGTLEIIRSNFENGKIMTDLGMKYGRTRYDIDSQGAQHDAKVHSPGAVLAIRGTNVSLYDQPPFMPAAESFTGRATFGYAKRTVFVGAKSGSYAKVVAGSNGAADTALQQSVVDPTSNYARSTTDSQLIAQQISRGAVLSFDPIANIPVITGGAGPLPDSTFAQNPPGAIDFYLRWSGNANLNLTVTLEKGDATNIILSFVFNPQDFLYPGFGLNHTADGGDIAFDHRGGPHGGEEIAFWGKAIPGLYGVSARNISGATTSFTFNAVANGKPLEIYTQELTKGTQIQRTISAGQEIVGLVPYPTSDLFNGLLPNDPSPSLPGDATNVSAANVSAAKVSKSVTKSVTPVTPSVRIDTYRPTPMGMMSAAMTSAKR
jgi:hypothetical protein